MKATKLIFKTFLSSAFKAGLLSSLIIAQVHFAYAQTASILPPAKTTFLDQNGKPLTGGTVKFYIPGTTTPKTTWQDSGETVPNTNPVVLDSAGRGIILGDGNYRQQVFDKKGNLIWDQQTSSTGSGGGGSTATVGDGDAVGTVKPWAGFIAPNQYVFSYGQELARGSFPELLAAITSQQNVSCTSASTTLTGLTDTSQIPIGAPIESVCLTSGTTIVSKTISTLVVSIAAIITTNTSARIFPFGDGDKSTTFNTPDLRGRTLAGRDNMGGVAASRLTSTYFGANASAIGSTGGLESEALSLAQLPTGITSSGSNSITVNSTANNVVVGTPTNGWLTGASVAFTAFNNGTASSGTITSTGANTINATSNNTGGTPHNIVQPTETLNYIIKTLPDTNPNSYFGVASLGGMTGVITCGFGITCAGNNISAVSSIVPAPTLTTLGGVFQSSASTNQFANGIDGSGNVLYAQPSFSNISGIATLAAGGTNASLTASNGGIFWSNATQGQILAGTATARLPLLSGTSAAPSWGAYTLPASITSGGIPYFSSTAAMSSSALLAANAFIVGGGAGAAPTSVAITGLVLGNGASAPTAYGGVTCTNQFARALSASGGVTCNTVSLTADVTGILPIANGGSNQSTALAARSTSGFNIDEATSTGDANYTILSTDRMVYHTSLTAARTDTLPAASSVNAGQVFVINDFRGVAGATNTVTLQRAGADTINGVTSLVAINSQYGAGIFWSDGASRWTFFPQSAGGGGGTVTQVNCGGGTVITTSGTCSTIGLPQGRLTLTSGKPVMVANATAQGTVYYDQYNGGNQVPYYNGTNDILDTIAAGEVSDAMVSAASAGQVVSGQVYDVWWVHGGANRICIAMSASVGGGGGWASDTGGSNTVRGTGYSQLDFTTRQYITNKNSITNCFNAATNYGPVSVNQGTYLGTIYATANGQTGMNFKPTAAAGGNNSILGVFNGYNRIPVSSMSRDSTTTWTYASATWRAANNNSNNSVSWVDGLQASMTSCTYQVAAASNTNISTAHAVGCNLNSTSATPTIIGSNFSSTNTVNFTDVAQDHFTPQSGFNTITAMESGSANTVLFGNNVAVSGFQNMALQVEISGM